MLLLTILACPPKQTAALGPAVPVLPAMSAPLYAWTHGVPPDEAVALVSQGLPWDEGLSGTAAAVALAVTAGEPIDRAQVRWAAYRAGWPYPVEEVIVQEVPKGELPERPNGFAAADAVGVARARGATGDVWVWLTSQAPVVLVPFPREQALGTSFRVEAGGGGSLQYRLVSPGGVISTGQEPLAEQGEWLLELESAGSRWVLPLYVDMLTPADAPYPWVHELPGDVSTTERQALTVLDEYRAEFESGVLERDPLLDKAASRALEAWQQGTPLPPAKERLGKLGMTGSLYELTCIGPTVPTCLDDLYWALDHRGALVDSDLQFVGVAAAVEPNRVLLVLDLAQE